MKHRGAACCAPASAVTPSFHQPQGHRIDAGTRIRRRRPAAAGRAGSTRPRRPSSRSGAAAPGGGHVALPPARASGAEPDPGRLREAGAALLAAARGLRSPVLARHRDAHDLGHRNAPLHQQLARHAHVPLAAARPEHLSGEQPRRGLEPDRRPVLGPRLRGRLRDRLRQGGEAARPGGRPGAAAHDGERHHDARRSRRSARAGRARRAGDGLPLRGPRARLRPDGTATVPRRLAVRNRAVVPPRRRI